MKQHWGHVAASSFGAITKRKSSFIPLVKRFLYWKHVTTRTMYVWGMVICMRPMLEMHTPSTFLTNIKMLRRITRWYSNRSQFNKWSTWVIGSKMSWTKFTLANCPLHRMFVAHKFPLVVWLLSQVLL